MLKTLDKQMLEVFQEFDKVFIKYVSSFFGDKNTTDLELVGDKSNRMFVFRLNNKRRETSDALSESQRIFVDFAFRLAVMEFFHTSSYFMCETPDSTLDCVFARHPATDSHNIRPAIRIVSDHRFA